MQPLSKKAYGWDVFDSLLWNILFWIDWMSFNEITEQSISSLGKNKFKPDVDEKSVNCLSITEQRCFEWLVVS